MANTEHNLQERLRANDSTALTEVYNAHKDAFISFAKGYGLDYDAIVDIYQDATIALYQNFAMGQKSIENSSIKTYLFGIGKFKIFDHLKRAQKVYALPDHHELVAEIPTEDDTLTTEQELLARYFKHLGERCQEVLKLFYYRGLSIQEIVDSTHYKDQNTVKSHKSRCLKQLKSLIHSPND